MSEPMERQLLIVDDNPRFSGALMGCFQPLGLFGQIDVLHSGEAALEYFGRGMRPDIIVLDMIMPGVDGTELLQRLKGQNLLEKTMVFVLSPITNDDMIYMIQRMGVVYYIAMPTSPEIVCNRVIELAALGNAGPIGKQEYRVSSPTVRSVKAEELIARYLHMLGIPAHFGGYAYLKTGILYCVDHYGARLGVTTHIYPEVAKAHHSTSKRVERSIRNAIDTAWYKGDIEAHHRIFGYTVNDNKGRPTNKEFIAMLTDRVALRLKYR